MATQGFAVYKDLLAIPHVARFSLFGVVAQFPFSMLAMAILIGVIVGAIWVVSHVALAAVLIFKPPVWVMFTVAVMIGINVPIGSMLRTRWTIVLAREPLRLNSALSLTSSSRSACG